MVSEDVSGTPARITAVHKERYELICEYGHTYGRLKTSIYYLDGLEAFPTTGDFVLVNYNPSGDSQIIKTLKRKSFFSRRDPTPGRGEQAVAANFDYVFIMQSLNFNFNLKRMERYITLAWQSGAVPVVILTKADLVDDYSEQMQAAQKVAAGAGVYAISAITGFGLDTLKDYLKPRKTIYRSKEMGTFNDNIISWLLEENNPAVAYRTKTELLGQLASKTAAAEWICSFIPDDWYKTKGLWYRYYVTAFAECGLTLEDMKREYIEKAFSELENTFDCNCREDKRINILICVIIKLL